MSLFLMLILTVSALPGFSQPPAQGKPRQTKTTAEYNSYNACFMEKDFAKKAELCEKFINDFKESDFLDNGYKLVIQSNLQLKNWQKVMDTADKAVMIPNADNSLKAFAFENAMIAAQNANDLNKVVSYGEKVLTVDPNNLNTLITLSAVIPQKSPSDKAQLDRAADMAKKALAGLQPILSQATPQQKPQLVQIDGTLHGTLGLIAYNEKDYTKSIQEYQTAIKDNAKDDAAHYYLAYDYIALMGQASKDYQDALKKENDAKTAKADQPTIDDLAAHRADLEDKIRKNRDMVIDELAKAVAINGPVAAQAKTELTKQWMAKNDSAAGLDEFIAQKKTELQ
jgi:hypothetical protein